jgi:hypothetical protein
MSKSVSNDLRLRVYLLTQKSQWIKNAAIVAF